MLERLQNILAHAGVASRRGAAAIIAAGRVVVDGEVVAEPGARVDPGTSRILVDGRRVAARERTRTILLYKPVGVLSTMDDPFGGKTVADLMRGKIRERLVPVGRLDKDSEGLLLMSNDGALTLRLTHPKYEHVKTYIVHAAGRWSDQKLDILRGPVEMPDGYITRPVPVRVVRATENNVTVLEFRLREGRKRQIRYMCSAAHLVVVSLKRVAIGALELPREMRPGEWRELTAEQCARLLEPPSPLTTLQERESCQIPAHTIARAAASPAANGRKNSISRPASTRRPKSAPSSPSRAAKAASVRVS